MGIPIPNLSKKLVERFNAKIIKTDGCWLWKGANRKGYGIIKIGRKGFLSTRVMVFLTSGVDPGDKIVLHSCDNPPCCRPDHLRIGTHLDNARDAKSRGRNNWGERNHFAKLSSADVLAIRREVTTKSREELCQQYSVSPRNLRRIIYGKGWKSLLVNSGGQLPEEF